MSAPVVTRAKSTPSTVANPVLRWMDRHPVGLLWALGALVAGLYLINLSSSPDFTLDELLYTKLGRHIEASNAISLVASPFLVHPPLFFFLGAGWDHLTGSGDYPVLTTLASVRVLSALLSAVTAVVTGLTARLVLVRTAPRTSTLAGVITTLLVATNGFMVTFGRMALIEPAAVAAGAVIVLVSYRIRHWAALPQIIVVGLLIGIGTLTKQTVIFAALTPVLAAALNRNRRQVLISGAAVLVGGVIWMSFPIWAMLNGHGSEFWNQQTVSIQRLIGLIHTTGVTLPNGSPLTQFLKTFWLYASGYGSLLIGAAALVIIVVRMKLISRTAPDRSQEGMLLIVAYAILSYGFVLYSFAFGAGNQQLLIYAAPASALLCVGLFFDTRNPAGAGRFYRMDGNGLDDNGLDTLEAGSFSFADEDFEPAVDRTRWDTPRKVVATVVLGGLLAVGSLTWVQYYGIGSDDGTAKMSAYISANVAQCVPVNATGTGLRWQVSLPRNPVLNYRVGQQAVNAGVHLFLLSPKDARYRYGNSSETLSNWVTSNGHLVFETPSRSSEDLQLWSVGEVSPATVTAACVTAQGPPSTTTPASEFLVILAAMLVLVGGGGAIAVAAGAKRRMVSPEHGDPVGREE